MYRSFSLSCNKKKIGNCPVEEAKKMKCYKRLIYKQFVQISGLCGPQFLSYLLKHFTHLCRALYGDVIFLLVYHFGAPIWPPEITRELRCSIRVHKHNIIFLYLKWLYHWKSRGETFFQWDSIPILVSRTMKTRKFKLLYFRNETCYRNGNWYKDLLFVYLQLSISKNL